MAKCESITKPTSPKEPKATAIPLDDEGVLIPLPLYENLQYFIWAVADIADLADDGRIVSIFKVVSRKGLDMIEEMERAKKGCSK